MWVLDIFLIHKNDGLFGFLKVSLGCTSKLFPYSLESENWYFWVLPTFIFCQIVRPVFQAWYVCRRGRAELWLNYQFSRKNVHKCLCRKFVSVWVLGILFPSLNDGKSCKISLVILMQMLTNSQREFKCNNIIYIYMIFIVVLRFFDLRYKVSLSRRTRTHDPRISVPMQSWLS